MDQRRKRQLPALRPRAGPSTPDLWGQAKAALPHTQAGPTEPIRQEAKGSADQELGSLLLISCGVQELLRTSTSR